MYRPASRRSVSSRVRPRSGGGGLLRIGIGVVMAVIAIISFLGSKSENPVTGESQYVGMTKEQEIAIGLQSAPEMAQQHGGLDPDQELQALVDDVGQRLITESFVAQSDYPFEFHLLADSNTVNAFALPGGQVFITRALFDQIETEGQLAGVLAHEIVHVIGRHSAERLAEMQLTQGLSGAVVIATYDPDDPSSQRTAQVAAMIGQLVNMKFGRDDEHESDTMGVSVMAEAGYDPRGMIGVMEILAAAASGPRPPEFFSTHPNPENRIGEIEAAIADVYPNGVPEGLQP